MVDNISSAVFFLYAWLLTQWKNCSFYHLYDNRSFYYLLQLSLYFTFSSVPLFINSFLLSGFWSIV